MSHFRISLGNAAVGDIDKKNILNSKICETITEKISAFKGMSFSTLKNFAAQSSVEYKIEDKSVDFTFYKKEIDSDNILLVVQAAYKTLKFPNYFSFNFVGKIIVDGIVVNRNNEFTKPDGPILWEFK